MGNTYRTERSKTGKVAAKAQRAHFAAIQENRVARFVTRIKDSYDVQVITYATTQERDAAIAAAPQGTDAEPLDY